MIVKQALSLLVLISLFNLQLCLDLSINQANKTYNIYSNNVLNNTFNSTTFDTTLVCKNGLLEIFQFLKGTNAYLQYSFSSSTFTLNQQDIQLQKQPINIPSPKIISFNPGVFVVDGGCPSSDQMNQDNYYSKLIITINIMNPQTNKYYQWSQLINCDKDHRHKKFEFGYLLIAILNALIIIGVALHSRIWSIRFKGSSLHLNLTWQRFLILIIFGSLCVVGFYFYANNRFEDAYFLLRIIGLVIAVFFTFICCDEIFFLIRPLKQSICGFLRRCDIVSGFITIGIIVGGVFAQNFIVNNILAIFICVGCIKLLKFRSLSQSVICMAIDVLCVTVAAIILHFTLDRSYNDYASQLSSPLFILFPDMINNLYKKCSWLPIVDIIVPGVMLAYLRSYDSNYNTGWGGVYTVIGNLSFILSTVLWILIEAIYPFSVPFCLITYPLVIISIMILAFKRNQLKTLWFGRFNMTRDSAIILRDDRISFDKLIDKQILKSQQIDSSILNDQDEQQGIKNQEKFK